MKKEYKYRTLRLLCLVISIVFVFSCGATDPDPQPASGKGSVALFLTGNISSYQQVVSTVTGVRLINSATAEICEVLKNPVTLNLANLADAAQYVDLASCPKGNYNRIDITVRKSTYVTNQLGTASDCSFTAYADAAGRTQPLACDQTTDLCTLSVRGDIRQGYFPVQEDRYNDLDIDLKKFTIQNFGDPSTCSVIIATSRMGSAELNQGGRSHVVSGTISGLDAATGTFALLTSGLTLTVDYSGILPALQPNIDQLLLFAQIEGLSVNVRTGRFNTASGSIVANSASVEAAGAASSVNGAPLWSFTLEYQPGKMLMGSYQPPVTTRGVFTDGVWVNVKLDGYDDASNEYHAGAVEVLPPGTLLND